MPAIVRTKSFYDSCGYFRMRKMWLCASVASIPKGYIRGTDMFKNDYLEVVLCFYLSGNTLLVNQNQPRMII